MVEVGLGALGHALGSTAYVDRSRAGAGLAGAVAGGAARRRRSRSPAARTCWTARAPPGRCCSRASAARCRCWPPRCRSTSRSRSAGRSCSSARCRAGASRSAGVLGGLAIAALDLGADRPAAAAHPRAAAGPPVGRPRRLRARGRRRARPPARRLAAPMPELIASPSTIEAAGTKPKLIEEFVGRVNTGEERLSLARMTSPRRLGRARPAAGVRRVDARPRRLPARRARGRRARRARRPGRARARRRVGPLLLPGGRRGVLRGRLPARFRTRRRCTRDAD